MKKIIHETLSNLEGYLISIQRNTETTQYELEIGIRNTWVYKSTDDIECEVVHESEGGNILKIYGKHEEIVIDDLVEFVAKIIHTNRKIAEMEEQFQEKLNQQKKEIQNQILEFQNMLDKLKEDSFDDETEIDHVEKEIEKEIKKEENKLSELEKKELEGKIS